VDSADSSDNDNEFSRLTDLLQSRGLPSHIVNAFGSKVHQFIHRSMSSGVSSRFQQFITSLQQSDDSLKLTALVELCQLLVMGNEDTLVSFPIKQMVPLLLKCMSCDTDDGVLANHACRALTHMMDALPRSCGVIADGIGTFLEKLQVVQCVEVAEQALVALENLSRRYSKQILNATGSGGVSACLTYIDFFSITSQRNALQIAANCCQNMIKEEFVHIQSSLPILSQRLTHSDKKSVESVCTLFARLVENFQHDSLILKEIASHSVFSNMQQLLLQSSLVSSAMFVTILHTIYLMCSNCNELAIDLLENGIGATLEYLLIGSKHDLATKSEKKSTPKKHSKELNNQVYFVV
jgi:E3 ubiquitin-protein ligase TRIP12